MDKFDTCIHLGNPKDFQNIEKVLANQIPTFVFVNKVLYSHTHSFTMVGMSIWTRAHKAWINICYSAPYRKSILIPPYRALLSSGTFPHDPFLSISTPHMIFILVCFSAPPPPNFKLVLYILESYSILSAKFLSPCMKFWRLIHVIVYISSLSLFIAE